MGKGGKGRKKATKTPKRRETDFGDAANDMMDDEIDAFHNQRDVVPLDIDDSVEESDEDDEHPVFDIEGGSDEEDDEEYDDGEDAKDATKLTGLAAKIERQQKYLGAMIGGVEDEMNDGPKEEEEKRPVWGRKKSIYYDADNVDYELQSSDEDLPAEEEAEVLRLQKEKAKFLSVEDFGLEDVSPDASEEASLEEILVKGKTTSKVSSDKGLDDADGTYEEVKKDLNGLSMEEQMDVVYSSAPELVGLLSELNDALEQLENKVNPFLGKLGEGRSTKKGGRYYLEVKQLLLLTYCQAIAFYLLLKSEGQPVRDHPVVARLVEIKNLLDKMKEIRGCLPSEIEEIFNKHEAEAVAKIVRKGYLLSSDSSIKDQRPSSVSTAIAEAVLVPHEVAQLVKVASPKNYEKKGGNPKHQNDQISAQSVEMLKARAALEEKLKLRGVFSALAPKDVRVKKRLRPVNGKLETLDDFDDDTVDIESGNSNGKFLQLSKLSQLVIPQQKKPKVVSGDDDLPKRDDIGERRRKHELRVLERAGINSVDIDEDESGTFEVDEAEMVDDEMQGSEEEEEEEEEDDGDDLYKQAEQKRAAKLAARAETHSRPPAASPLPEVLVDGKRQITYQMEKNRGLTRSRKKLTKNPRKKYKLKHKKAVVRRKGQVREFKGSTGPYSGEASGINARISRSIRFNN